MGAVARRGWMRWVAGIAVGALATICLYIFYAFGLHHPASVYFDPVMQSVWRAEAFSPSSGPAVMKPCCFEAGELRAETAKQLVKSGFERIEMSDRELRFFGPDYASPDVEVYSRTVTKFPCMTPYYVALRFDDQGLIVRSETTSTVGACL